MAVPHHAVPACTGLLHDGRDVYVYLYKLEIIFSKNPTHTTGDVPVFIPGVKRSFPQKAPFSAKAHVGTEKNREPPPTYDAGRKSLNDDAWRDLKVGASESGQWLLSMIQSQREPACCTIRGTSSFIR
jgi:hypothetical protein